MKKGLKKFLLVILALFLAYQVDDFFWQRDREGKVERVINAMRDSLGEMEAFLRENEDDLEYLVTRCVEDDLAIYDDSVQFVGGPGNPKKIVAEPELLSRRDRLIANLPGDICFYHIYDTGMYFSSKDAVFETPMYMELSSPQLSEHTGSHVAGSIGTIELRNTWTVNVIAYDYWDWRRACKILEENWADVKRERETSLLLGFIVFLVLAFSLIYRRYHSFRRRRQKEAGEQAS